MLSGAVAFVLACLGGVAGLGSGAQAATITPVGDARAAAAGDTGGTASAVPSASSTAGASSTAPSASSGTHSGKPQISLEGITPNAPQRNSTIQIRGTFSNGSKALDGASVGLGVGAGPLSGRASIAAVGKGRSPAGAEGALRPKPTAELPSLAAGQSAGFTLSVAAGSLHLGGDGVYELSVEVFTGSTTSPSRTAVVRTFLPWFPSTSGVKPTRIATLWPLTDTPRVQAQTYSASGNDAQTPVLSDDTASAEMARGGRLDQLVSVGSGLQSSNIPVTWVVDPDLLDTAHTMTTGYRTAAGDDSQGARADNTKEGAGGSNASNWLTSAKSAVQGREVVSLPYADPDLASIAHNGSGSKALSGELAKSATAGQFTVDGRLQVDADNTVAWPYQGYTDTSIVHTAEKAGDRTMVVNGQSMPDSLNYTPSASRSIGSGMTAVVSDKAISDIFSGDLSTPGSQTLAEQRFLAETLMITLELPSTPRSLLVTPPRNMSAGAARALSAALEYAVQGKWAAGASLKSVSTANAGSDADHTVPPVSKYPAKARAGELSSSTLNQVMGVQNRLGVLEKILTLKYRVINPFSTAIARSLSTAWRASPSGGDAYRASMQDYLTNLQSAVKILPKSDLKLTGTSGTIPVTVQNDLQQPVNGLRLVLSSSNWLRLNISQAQNVTVDGGGRNKTFSFKAGARANKGVDVTAQLYTTADNHPFGNPISFEVNVTSVTGGVVWVLAIGGLLVLLAGLRMYGQRKKRATLGEGPDEDPEALLAPDDDPSGDHDPRIGSESRG